MNSSKSVNGKIGDPNLVILYVRSASESARLYAELLGKQPSMSTPDFEAFRLDSGVTFGLWSRDDVQPVASATGGSEICFPVADGAIVKATHEAWQKRGLKIAQQPTEMDFGPTFVALDPDGHRLRVFAPRAV